MSTRSPAASTVATLLPGAEFSTRSPYPDARRLLDAGVTVALATDCNPGTSYTSSMPFVIALAVREMHMTADEALWAATAGGAAALQRTDIGRIAVGARADLAVLSAPSYLHLAYRPGVPIARALDLAERTDATPARPPGGRRPLTRGRRAAGRRRSGLQLRAEAVEDAGEERAGGGGVDDVGDLGVRQADRAQPVDVGLLDRGRVGRDGGRELVDRAVLVAEPGTARVGGDGEHRGFVAAIVAQELRVRGGAVGGPQRPRGGDRRDLVAAAAPCRRGSPR